MAGLAHVLEAYGEEFCIFGVMSVHLPGIPIGVSAQDLAFFLVCKRSRGARVGLARFSP